MINEKDFDWEAFWDWLIRESKEHGGIFNLHIYLENMKKRFKNLVSKVNIK